MVTKKGDYTCTILFGYHIQSFFLEFVLELFEYLSYILVMMSCNNLMNNDFIYYV